MLAPVVVLAAACGATSAGIPRLGSSVLVAHLATPDRTASATRRSGPPDSERPAIARRAARRILGDVILPGGSAARSRPPSKHLRQPPSYPGDPNLVDLHRFVVVPRSAASLLAFLRANPEHGSTLTGSGTLAGRGGVYEWDLTYGFPPVGTVLDSRGLVESVVSLGARTSGLRLDAQVTWLPAKPAGDLVPASAKLLTAWLSKGLGPDRRGHRPVTTARKALVAAIRGDLNRLEVEAPGVHPCPVDFGQLLHLVFRARVGARPLAVVLVDTSGCESVTVIRRGHAVKPQLRGNGLAARLEQALGWRAA